MMKILIVEDDNLLLRSIMSCVENIFEEVYGASSIKEAKNIVLAHAPQVILLDDRLPDGNGIKFIPFLKEINPISEIVVMTAYGDSETVIEAIKKGAFHYIPKPFEVEELVNILKRASSKVRRDLEKISSNISEIEIIGISEAIGAIRKLINSIKELDVPVLIVGETGTGKELVVKQLHFYSKRRMHPL